MKVRKFDQPVRLVAIVTMLFMLFGAVGPLMQGASAQTIDSRITVQLCHDLDTNDNLHLSQGELNALLGAPYNFSADLVAQAASFCEARPSLTVDPGNGTGGQKVFVCKYVGTPNVDERLQTGNNPISVSVNAIPNYQGIGSFFADAQGRSFVLAEDTRTGGGQTGEPSVDDCPPPDTGVTPTPTEVIVPSPTPTEVIVPSPTVAVTPTEGVNPTEVVRTPVPPGVTPTEVVKTPVTPGVNPTEVVKTPVTVVQAPAPAPVTALPSTGSGTSQADQVMFAVGGIAALALIAVGIRKHNQA